MGSLIDFKQVATQIVGFLIFLFLIRKYAWGPVLGTLEARRAKIVGDLAHAEKEKQDAAALKADLDRQLKGIEAQARQKIQEAVSEGQNTSAKCPAFLPPATNCEGWSMIGPKPPALSYAHHSSTKQMTILMGAV